MWRKMSSLVLIIFCLPIVLFAQTLINADSIYNNIQYLCQEIGPRQMGSLHDRQALEWTVSKFRAYGADSAFIIPFSFISDKRSKLNTQSGSAVGVFIGSSDTSIVIGGHIDSTPSESVGANDDASGTATVIELARVWALRPRHYTMVFAAFSGEEQGLGGSRSFVNDYKDIDKVALMISLDMTGSDDDILVMLETSSDQAPKWLVKDAFTLDRQLGINRLLYPTHYAAINDLTEGSGSDHEPFLNHHIPAIDFTAGINNSPVHSEQDNLENIDKPMLARCAQLADSLVGKYQKENIPASGHSRYMFWHPFGMLLFIPKFVLVIIEILAVLMGVWAFWLSRKQRLIVDKSQRIRFTGLKSILLFCIVAAIAQCGEAIIQLVKGLRHPWMIHVNAYLWLLCIWGIAGVWLALQIARKWSWNKDGHIYANRAIIILTILLVLFAFGSAPLAIYPALSLILFSAVVLVRHPVVRVILALLAPLPILRLAFSEVFIFIARMSSEASIFINAFWKSSLYTLSLILLLLFVFLPFIFTTLYVVIKIPFVQKCVKQFRRPFFGIGLAVILMAATFIVYRMPSYNNAWRPELLLEAKYSMPKNESKLELLGSEYLKDVKIVSDTLNMTFSASSCKEKIPSNFTADWVSITGTQSIKAGEKDTVNIDWRLKSREPWFSVELSVKADTLEIEDVQSNLKYRHSKESMSFRWRADPPDTISVQAGFVIHPRAKLIRQITATYLKLPLPATVTAPDWNIRYRTKVTLTDTLDIRGKN